MADKKITGLPATSGVNLTDVIEKVTAPSGASVSEKATIAQLRSAVLSGLSVQFTPGPPTLYDFDQVFTPSVSSLICAYAQIGTNEDGEGRIDAEIATVGDSDWVVVGSARISMVFVTGPVAVNSLVFTVPVGKKWRIHNTNDPVLSNQPDYFVATTLTVS